MHEWFLCIGDISLPFYGCLYLQICGSGYFVVAFLCVSSSHATESMSKLCLCVMCMCFGCVFFFIGKCEKKTYNKNLLYSILI